ncbi:gamma-butyrobetaine dioxygenase-like isoform X2 [Eriocheir sinensis]|uniref:gamma-butyrobetaine dioxygenase-like isoform X2 n=1 Tax=Eriocheir sinensis TaxID=95602 RepID=UPI0021C71841|nr:gamma-butyrobetaine dioxygenase-like isoform X2 [Eriocheir sinensis]
MSATRVTRALFAGAAALRGPARFQVRGSSSGCASCTSCGKNGQRDLSLTTAARQLAVPQLRKPLDRSVVWAEPRADEILQVKFGDGTDGHLPFVWLRDNCQCPECFSEQAQGRKLLFDSFNLEAHPKTVQETPKGLLVVWNDGHESEYSTKWLQDRAFTPTARAVHRERYALRREPWGAEHRLKNFDYNTLMSDEHELLDWLLTMERQGSAMVRNTPRKDVAGPELIEHIAFVKQSHYGPHSPVINRPNTNNVAFTNAKLGMHNDLPQYEHMPGIIFIQCVEQHPGAGGESVVTDGLFAAEELRRNHPEDFRILATTDMYFWDKGHANYSWEMPEFHKIAKFPVIRVNSNNEVVQIAVNNAIRDSHMDLPPHKVKKYYAAYKRFHEILYANAITFKMEAGDMMTLDNVRCLHGREGYEANSARHIESSYLDWDEARCRRRRLQEQFGSFR